MTFDRTKTAAEKDRTSRWDLIEAMIADAVDAGLPIVGKESTDLAAAACKEAGVEFSTLSIRNLLVVGKFDHESTSKQRRIWRRYGWTVVREVVKAGWTQDAAYELLAGSHKSKRDVQAAVRSDPGVTNRTFDERCAAWISRANDLLADGAALAEEAESQYVELGAHSTLALSIYRTMVERQLDAEIRTLLEANA